MLERIVLMEVVVAAVPAFDIVSTIGCNVCGWVRVAGTMKKASSGHDEEGIKRAR